MSGVRVEASADYIFLGRSWDEAGHMIRYRHIPISLRHSSRTKSSMLDTKAESEEKRVWYRMINPIAQVCTAEYRRMKHTIFGRIWVRKPLVQKTIRSKRATFSVTGVGDRVRYLGQA